MIKALFAASVFAVVPFSQVSAQNVASGLTDAEQGNLRSMGSPTRIPGQFIVVLKEARAGRYVAERPGSDTKQAVDYMSRDLALKYGGRVDLQYDAALKGFSVSGIDDRQAARLASDEDVEFVEADQRSELFQSPAPSWGLDRIDQRDLPLNNAYTYTGTGSGINVYVIDSGIFAHGDFGTRLKAGHTEVNDGYGTSDCNGHGTAVAGIIGGSAYGVAKGVALYPVRVFGCDVTSSPNSVLIAGINWVTSNHVNPAIANMSFGGSTSSALDSATTALISSGVTVAIAAGNSAGDACNVSPARVAAAITVGGSTNSDQMYSLSNFGSCVDVYAPGENISSDLNVAGTTVGGLQGTSVAAPHVAGVAALIKAATPSATPATIAKQIHDSATPGKVNTPGVNVYCVGSGHLLYSGAASPPGSPATVATLDAERICNDRYKLTWSGVGATLYEIFLTNSSQPGCESRYSTTPTVTMTVTPPAGATTTYRVRGCNSIGCGGYSPPKSLGYYSGCQ